jgi:hypothetical protein
MTVLLPALALRFYYCVKDLFIFESVAHLNFNNRGSEPQHAHYGQPEEPMASGACIK